MNCSSLEQEKILQRIIDVYLKAPEIIAFEGRLYKEYRVKYSRLPNVDLIPAVQIIEQIHTSLSQRPLLF